MKRLIVSTLVLFVFAPCVLMGQILIKGNIFDKQGDPIIGANIFIEGTFSGTSSNVNGTFSFETDEVGAQRLIASYIGFEEISIPLVLGDDPISLQIELKEAINKIDAVTITAGTFSTGSVKKREVLKELDIITTAGATGDITGALNTLPGTQTVGEEGKLYVRGGEDYETKTFIDGMRVVKPYHTTVPQTATRNRFSPFMFKGTSFSTGGYSAEYGQGLSSALILTTKEKADQTRTDLTVIPFGGEVAQSFSGERSSIAGKVGYFNMNPYYAVVPQDIDWIRAPESVDANLVLRNKVGKYGVVKAYGNFTWSSSKLNRYDINDPSKAAALGIDNLYGYLNTSYKNQIGEKWAFFIGTSYNSNQDRYSLDDEEVKENTQGGQVKLAFSGTLSERIDLNWGIDFFQRDHTQIYQSMNDHLHHKYGFKEQILATFAEADIYFSNKFLARIGLRSEYGWLNLSHKIDPRISIAYKTGDNSNVSMAYGKFQQATNDDLLRIADDLVNEKSTHYILNYQYLNRGKVFRIEGYYKNYQDLAKYDPLDMYDVSSYNNNGYGYARGIDIFWRDSYGGIKNADYWISYSFLDTKREYRDFPKAATPYFASKHNISVAYKQFLPKLRSLVSGTYTFASGRPYDNPNLVGFNQGRTKSYHDLSATIAYMATENIGVFVMCTNVLGVKNVFGYEYSTEINDEGVYNRRAITPPARRFLVIGATMTLSKNGVMNQLRSL